MNRQLIMRNIWRFLLLVLLQILVFNNIYLGGYINPCLYVLFIIMLPTATPKNWVLVISFATGFVIDIFTNMAGFHAAAATAVGFLKTTWLNKLILRDNDDEVETPGIHSVAYQQFLLYLFILLLAFNLIYYTLLSFNLRDILHILLASLLSTIVTWLLAILYQSLFLRKNDKRAIEN